MFGVCSEEGDGGPGNHCVFQTMCVYVEGDGGPGSVHSHYTHITYTYIHITYTTRSGTVDSRLASGLAHARVVDFGFKTYCKGPSTCHGIVTRFHNLGGHLRDLRPFIDLTYHQLPRPKTKK
jgi:hypothetical protein